MKQGVNHLKYIGLLGLLLMFNIPSFAGSEFVEQARGNLAILKERLRSCSSEVQIQKFQEIVEKMDQYNQAADRIFAPYLCEYLLPSNPLLSNEQKGLREIPEGYTPLLFGLIIKYDAKIALMKNDRMQLDNLVKAIDDIWGNLKYGHENTVLSEKVSRYLKQTDYETACVMDFNIPDRIGRNSSTNKEGSETDVVVQQNKSKWNILLNTAKLINSSNFAGGINVYKDNVDKGIRRCLLYEEVRNSLSELMPKDEQSINDNMIEYMADYFYNYINRLQEYFEKEFVISVVDCGFSDPETFNTCGINSLLISDTQEGNFQNLRKEVCLLLERLGKRDNNLQRIIQLELNTYGTSELKTFSQSSHAFQSILPYLQENKILDNFTSPNLLECAAYATNYNCIVLLDSLFNGLWSPTKITLNQLPKAVSILSPLLPIKLIKHNNAFHYQSVFLKNPTVPDNRPDWIKEGGRYNNPQKWSKYQSEWYKRFIFPMVFGGYNKSFK